VESARVTEETRLLLFGAYVLSVCLGLPALVVWWLA
jgi:hypothetical protein